MPDLSNLLGAVYGEGPSSTDRDPEDEAHVEKEPAAAERGPAVPDWADDEHLDAAFAEWKPASSDDGSEHAFVMDAEDDPAPPLADDLAAALSEALVAASGTADDSTEPPPGQEPPKHFDFSVPTDQEEETHEVSSEVEAPDPEPVIEPKLVTELEPHVSPEPELAAEPEPEPELVAEPEPEPVTEPEPKPEPVSHLDGTDEVDDADDEVYEAPRPSFTTQREAAAELTAASRIESEPVVTPHADETEPEFAPLPAAPVPVTPQPTPMPSAFAGDPAVANDGATAPTTLPADTRRWERSDDDILPEKAAKKGFSFSLRRG